jgi:Mycothiol maleylpyruvate isomerase N-terminal domain
VISRDEAVGLLEQQHGAVAELLSELDEDAFTRRGTIGGGDWSAKDLAAHLGSWEAFSLEAIEAFGRGERPAIEDRIAPEGAIDRINADELARFLDADPQQVLTRFEDLHRRVVGEIRRMEDEAWAAPYPHNPDADTLGDRVGALLSSDDGDFMHASAHLPDLRAYVDSIAR